MENASIRFFVLIISISISMFESIAMEQSVDSAEYRQPLHKGAANQAAACASGKSTGEQPPAATCALTALYAKRISGGYKPERWEKIKARIFPIQLLPSLRLQHGQHAWQGIRSVAWSPNDAQLAGASYTAVIWDVKSGKIVKELKHQAEKGSLYDYYDVREASWNPDGTQLVTQTMSAVYNWNAQTGEQKYRVEQPERYDQKSFIACSPDGTRIVMDDCILNSQTGSIEGSPTLLQKGYHHPSSANWSHDSAQLATVYKDNSIIIWDSTTKKRIHELNFTEAINAIIWNHDDTKLMIACQDKKVRICDIITHAVVKTLEHRAAVKSIILNHDGTQLATVSDAHQVRIIGAHAENSNNSREVTVYTVSIWNTTTGENIQQEHYDAPITGVAWNNDSSQFAIASNKCIDIWYTKIGKDSQLPGSHRLRVRNGCSNPIMTWNHAGTHLATTSLSHEANVWDTTTHLTDPQFLQQHNQLKQGTLTPEQLMAIILCDEYRQKIDQSCVILFNRIATHDTSNGISTAQLASALLTLHPVIANGVLAAYRTYVKRGGMLEQCSYKVLEEIRDGYNVLAEAQKYVPQSNTNAIKIALEECIVGECS